MSDGPRHYDFDGQPCTFHEWVDLVQRGWNDDRRFVGRTEIGGYLVSTVWLGLDYSFGHGEPLMFETMIFDNRDIEYDTDDELHETCRRWPSRHAAELGHAAAVNYVRDVLALRGDG